MHAVLAMMRGNFYHNAATNIEVLVLRPHYNAFKDCIF